MSDDPFGKWWPCLRKHYKRVNLWLPRAKALQMALAGQRPFRYFTLCARPMIDVYMLVREKVLSFDKEAHRVRGVSFCECNETIFPEMKELIGVEEAGFLGRLEDLVLFRDGSPQTQTLDTVKALTQFLEGEGLDESVRLIAESKRTHLQFMSWFPFDFLNLDFCDRYYGDPPDVMKIHATIDRLLDWQRRPGSAPGGGEFSVERFVVAITCRVGSETPASAVERLKRAVEDNRTDHAAYDLALQARSIGNLDSWAHDDPLDFFMSAWPKEIARLARQKSWDIKIHDHAFYDRRNDEGVEYHMVCLVVEFVQAAVCRTYLEAVTKCLDAGSRAAIPRIDPDGGDGARLLSGLREIVNLRNRQARLFDREPLPEPLAEILRLRGLGVPI
jgi:hypothetical protein